MNTVDKITFRLATDADNHLPTYDNTKLAAFNTCPTWGILTYQMHKKMNAGGRRLPLEAGSVMHEMFSWVRLCSLWQLVVADRKVKQKEHATIMFNHHGERLFGKQRFTEIKEQTRGTEERNDRCKAGAVAVLETSTYYDDPKDKRRTISNMIECSLAYIDKWRWDDPVWVRDIADPYSDVGIEIPFDLVVTMDTSSGQKVWRYIGKIDGIHWHNDRLTLHENKTASRLNDAWSMSFAMASQVTGYCIAASVFTERQVRNADVLGITIPLPKSYDYGGIVREPVSRQDYHFEQWANWSLHTIQGYEDFAHNPHDAPKYTHSCNRYFSPCSLLPFCDSEKSDQVLTISEMVTEEWSPLHEKVGD